MKNVLALVLVTASTIVSQAAIIDLSAVVTGTPDITGVVTASSYDNSAGTFTLAGNLSSASTAITTASLTGYVEGPGAFKSSLTIDYNDGAIVFFDKGATAVPGSPVAWPSGYSVTFYNAGVQFASGTIVAGDLSNTPEPQTYAMVAGAALLGFAAFRRARR